MQQEITATHLRLPHWQEQRAKIKTKSKKTAAAPQMTHAVTHQHQ
jgi:hypothetical protein